MRMRILDCGIRIGTTIALCLLSVGVAQAATGVSEERLSLPDGPGSLEGIGENIEMNLNMAQMSYDVAIQVPEGYAGMTPSVSLDYSSGSGNSVVGMGWTLSMPNIERLTVRGLPRYGVSDEFSVDGGAELVYVGGTSPRIYRSRFESGFVRYSWFEAGTGAEGYWTAEYPDGRISYYGADHEGTLVADTRVSGTAGTFRFHLVETTDRYGHSVRYSYDLYGNVTLMNHIGWVFVGDEPQYEVSFEYEDRNDNMSDCRAGFEELLTKRLMRVNVRAHQTLLRQYELAYEDYTASGGFTRLVGVQQLGADGGVSPIQFGFEYSRALGVQCMDGCEKPYVISMGSLGVDIAQGKTTLMDINGDSLPDVLDTTEAGKPHRFFMNHLAANGTHTFSAALESAVGTQSSHAKGSPFVHELDLDGDGFTDLLNAQTGQLLVNRGAGDWTEAKSAWQGDGGLPDLGAEGTLASVKFMDYDGDKKIDLIFSQGDAAANSTMVFRNTGTNGFVADENATPIGIGFETPALELNDMNGDGLLDVVVVTKDALRYRLNLGWGHWSEWQVIEGFTFTDQEALQTEVEDLNGDGLADLCLVAGNELRYWINRNGASFDPEVKVTSADITGSMPERLLSTTVLHADMNGNGSSDVVWVQAGGEVSYLELFPVRPNLLTRITNGLGRVTDVTYVPSVQERARDQVSAPWTHPLPFPMTVVKTTDEWDELSGVHSITEFMYHDGFYDGVEKRFRGYSLVEGELAGDALQESGYTLEEYNVGVTDPYSAGLLLSEEQRSDGQSIQMTIKEYADCDVADVTQDGLLFPVRNVCQVKEIVESRERLADSGEWATTTTEWEYDGYGNVVLESKLGVTAMGGGACPACVGTGYTGTPCGPKCLGDEAYTRTTYVVPAGNSNRWILGKPVLVRTFGVATEAGEPATNVYTETKTMYDGPNFEGLPQGEATHGVPTRVVGRESTSNAQQVLVRNKLDAHGNVVETLDPLGTSASTTHRRVYTMDDEGLDVVAVEVLNEDGQGPYALRQEVKYDLLWSKPVESTAWMKVVDGVVVDPAQSTYYTYDEFGRITSIIRPGDSLDKPTEEYEYNLGTPVSAVITHTRSKSGSDLDLEEVRCLDGRGRAVQTRTRVAANKWRVMGFTTFNMHGSTRNSYYPYEETTGSCALVPPADVLQQQYRYDALGRQVELISPPAGDETDEAVLRTVLRPLDRLEYDLEDTRPGSPNANTPTRVVRNGQDQIIRVENLDKPNGTPLVHTIRYDELGRLAAVVDPLGLTQSQETDMLGRVVKVDHPDAGTLSYGFDEAGNLIRTEDSAGKVVLTEFDGLNRVVARWDDSDKAGTLITWTYDRVANCPADKCTNVVARTAEVSYATAGHAAGEWFGYDVRGQRTFRRMLADGGQFDSSTVYDNAGRITSLVHPSGLKIDTVLDGSGRAIEVPGYIDQITYEPDGLIGTLLGSNGVETTRTYDERKRLTAALATGPGGAAVVAYTLALDSVGNVTEIADDRDEEAAPQGSGRYTYDSMYRLVKAELDPARPAYAETLTYTFDAADRVLSATSDKGATSPAHVGNLTYGTNAGPHAVTLAGELAYKYDAVGQLTDRGPVKYQWDAFGRMVKASEGSDTLATFGYGEANDRLLKVEGGHRSLYLAEDFEIRDGTAITYLVLGSDRFVRIEEPAYASTALSDVAPATGPYTALTPAPDDVISAGDAWLAHAAATGAMAFAGTVSLSSPEVMLHASANRMLFGLEPRTTWLHTNHRGDVTAETDEEGAVASRTEYYPFGSQRFSDGDQDPHGFTGKEQDDSTGLTYFGARYLDPWTGRWTAPDPTFLVLPKLSEMDAAETTGTYLFAGNNPVTLTDPDGRNNTPFQTQYYRQKSALKGTVKELVSGKIRPSIGFATAFGLQPGQKISKKLAWKLAKTAYNIGKKDNVAPDAFHLSSNAITLHEWRTSLEEIRESPIYQKVAYEQGGHKDLMSFSIMGTVVGGKLDTMRTRDKMVKRGTYVGPSKHEGVVVGTSNVPVNADWIRVMSNEAPNVEKVSFKGKSAWQKFKGFFKRKN